MGLFLKALFPWKNLTWDNGRAPVVLLLNTIYDLWKLPKLEESDETKI